MALPEQVVERLSREPLMTPGWSGRLLMFASTVFFLSVAVYIGLTFGYKPYLSSQVQKLDDEIQKFNQETPAADQNQLVVFYSQLANLNTVLKGHVAASPLFDWLEAHTQTRVMFSKFAFSAQNGQLALTGISKGMDDFVEQLAIFQAEPMVQRITVNNVSVIPAGGWQFDVVLFLDPSVVGQAPPAAAAPTPASAPAPAPVSVSTSTPTSTPASSSSSSTQAPTKSQSPATSTIKK
jgi:hypothetical protein